MVKYGIKCFAYIHHIGITACENQVKSLALLKLQRQLGDDIITILVYELKGRTVTMLKMVIRMDDNKINTEKRYRLDGIYKAIESTFSQMGLPRMEGAADSLVYCDNGHIKGYGRFGKIVNTLKKQPWFMENVAVWLLCDSDDSDSPDDFNEEDLLNHYRKKRIMEV